MVSYGETVQFSMAAANDDDFHDCIVVNCPLKVGKTRTTAYDAHNNGHFLKKLGKVHAADMATILVVSKEIPPMKALADWGSLNLVYI